MNEQTKDETMKIELNNEERFLLDTLVSGWLSDEGSKPITDTATPERCIEAGMSLIEKLRAYYNFTTGEDFPKA